MMSLASGSRQLDYSPAEKDRIRQAIAALVDNDPRMMSQLDEFFRGASDAAMQDNSNMVVKAMVNTPGKVSYGGNTMLPPAP